MMPVTIAVPTSLEYFASLVAEDASLPLLEAVAAVGQCEEERLDVQGVVHEVDKLVARLRATVSPEASELQRLWALNHLLFREMRFASVTRETRDPSSAFLHRALQTRAGNPLALAVLYLELANAIGLRARTVSFPGHFFVKLRMLRGEEKVDVLIDPVSGMSLSRDELTRRLAGHRQNQGQRRDWTADEKNVPVSLLLQPASARDTLARLLRKHKEVHRTTLNSQALLPVQQRLVQLLPGEAAEVRDLGSTYAALGRRDEAMREWQRYLTLAPLARDVPIVTARLHAMRRRSDAPPV